MGVSKHVRTRSNFNLMKKDFPFAFLTILFGFIVLLQEQELVVKKNTHTIASFLAKRTTRRRANTDPHSCVGGFGSRVAPMVGYGKMEIFLAFPFILFYIVLFPLLFILIHDNSDCIYSFSTLSFSHNCL